MLLHIDPSCGLFMVSNGILPSTHTVGDSKTTVKRVRQQFVGVVLITQQQAESAGSPDRQRGRQTEVTHQGSLGIGTSAPIDHSPVVIGSQNEFLHRQMCIAMRR